MKTHVLLKPRTAFLGLFSLGSVFLSACQATSDPALARWSEPAFAGIPDAGRLGELSGITRSNIHPGIFWAVNDGDNPAEIIAVDAQARTRSVLTVEGVRNIDWEDIANYRFGGRNYLAVADTGDNGGIRPELFIHVFEEPAELKPAMRIRPVRSIRFVWPDGPRDAESLFASSAARSFYLISKKRVPAELFALPFDAADGSRPALAGTLHGITQPDAKTMNDKGDYGRYRAQITGADLSPDGSTIAVLNYQQINFFAMPGGRSVAALKPIAALTLPWLPQAEGIAYSQDGDSLLVGSEQTPTPIIRFDKLKP